MQQNYNEESFKKGEQFEKYVEEIIFPDAHYELLYKTSDSKQNTRRFVQKSLEPDFHFKCRVTGKEFYVELSYLLRKYVESSIYIKTLEMTTEEIDSNQSLIPLKENLLKEWILLLKQADLIKY